MQRKYILTDLVCWFQEGSTEEAVLNQGERPGMAVIIIYHCDNNVVYVNQVNDVVMRTTIVLLRGWTTP